MLRTPRKRLESMKVTCAVQLLAAKTKLSKNIRHPKNAAKLARNGKVKTSVSMSLS